MTVSVSDPTPVRPGNITGNVLVCTGRTETYTISPVPTADDLAKAASNAASSQGMPSNEAAKLGQEIAGSCATAFIGQPA
jgi:hypothetical protein